MCWKIQHSNFACSRAGQGIRQDHLGITRINRVVCVVVPCVDVKPFAVGAKNIGVDELKYYRYLIHHVPNLVTISTAAR